MKRIKKYLSIFLALIIISTSINSNINTIQAFGSEIDSTTDSPLISNYDFTDTNTSPPSIDINDVNPSLPTENENGNIINGRKSNSIIVKLRQKKSDAEIVKRIKRSMKDAGISQDATLAVEEKIDELNVAIVSLEEGVKAEEVVASIKSDEIIEFVQQDYIISGMSIQITRSTLQDFEIISSKNETTTPQALKQWGIKNEGQIINDREGIPGVDINLLPVYESNSTFSEIIVGIIDTGIDTTHNSLLGKTVAGYDFVNMDNTVFDEGDLAHGTQIAGVIAANSYNNEVRGVADNVKIMPLKFFQDGYGYTSDAIAAIEYAKKNGAKIINCSWGSDIYNPILKEVMKNNSDILFVCAAGNNGSTKNIYPAAFDLPNVISVTSINNVGELSTFANFGPTVNIAAPGEDIYTTYMNNKYNYTSGTSLAVGFVSGVSALFFGKNEQVTPSYVKDAVLFGATETSNLNGQVTANGYLNAAKTLDYKGEKREEVKKPTGLFEIPPEVAYILELTIPYESLTEEQKDLLEKYMFLRRDTMTECSKAGYSIKLSVKKAQIMQRLSLSLADALRMIQNHGDEDKAWMQSGKFTQFQINYAWLNNYYQTDLINLLVEGYGAKQIVYSFMVSKALELPHIELIQKEPIDLDTLDFGGFSEEEIKILKEQITIYDLDPFYLINYLKENFISPTELKEKTISFQLDNNLFVSHSNELLGGAYSYETKGRKYPETPFTFNNGGTEGVNLSTGSLAYEDTIAKIPGRNGLDLQLTLQYDSANSNIEKMHGRSDYEVFYTYRIYVVGYLPGSYYPSYLDCGGYSDYYDNMKALSWAQYVASRYVIGTYQNVNNVVYFISDVYIEPELYYQKVVATYNEVKTQSYENPFESIGDGWNFKFSRVIIDDVTGEKFLRLANGSTYKYEKNTKNTKSNLKNYLLDDIIFEVDLYGMYNNSKYILTYKNGTKEYFDGKGRIVGIEDSFKNRIDFEHKVTSSYNGEILITDSGNHLTRITYNPNNVTISLPDSKTVSYSLNKQGNGTELKSKTDQMGRVTTYQYINSTAKFDFFNKGYGVGAKDINYRLLSSITYPNNANTIYTYNLADGNLGDKGLNKYFRIGSRYDYADNQVYNQETYTFSNNNYTGYPTAKDKDSLASDFTYDTTISYIDGTTKKYTFNHNHLVNNMIISLNSLRKLEQNNTYDANKQILTSTKIIYGNGINQSITEQYTYDKFGDLLEYWNPLADGNRINTENKKTFVYDAKYHQLLTSTYNKDKSTTIKEEYTLTTNGMSVSSFAVYENGVVKNKSSFTEYDNYGNYKYRYDYIDENNYILTENTYQNGIFVTSSKIDNIVTSAIYDLYGRVLSSTDGKGYVTKYEYDAVGRLTKVINPDSTVKTTIYDDNARTETITNENGLVIRNHYDKLGNLVLVQDITNGTVNLNSYSYDHFLRVHTETNARNTVTTYEYDYLNRVITKAIADLYKETYNYEDVYNRTLSKVTKTIEGDASAPSIKTASYSNIYGFPEMESRYINNTEYIDTFNFDYLGNKLEHKTADGRVTSYNYNHAGQVTKITNPDGSIYQTSYDMMGRKIGTVDPKGNTSKFVYDSWNNLIRETFPANDRVTTKYYGYDANNNLLYTRQEINDYNDGEYKYPHPLIIPRFTKINYEYNNRNYLTKVINYNNDVVENYTTYEYDSVGNKTAMVTANGEQRTTYEYDKQNRLIKLTDPLNQSESYTYDNSGNLISRIDRNKNVTTNSYDALNRIINTTFKNQLGISPKEFFTYEYSKTGAKVQEKNENLTVDFIYDDAGRLTQQLESNGFTKTYTYDIHNNRNSFILNQNGSTKINQTYDYDNMNRMIKTYDFAVLKATYTYDINGNRSTLSYSNGVFTTYTYNNANMVKSLINKKESTVLSSYSYGYDYVGNQLSKQDHISSVVTNYTYDDMGRLTSEEEVKNPKTANEILIISKSYTFDKANNRTSMKVVGMERYNTTYSYDSNNRLIIEEKTNSQETEKKMYAYDANGNQIGMTMSSLGQSTGDEELGIYLLGQATDNPNISFAINQYNVINQLTQTQNEKGTVSYIYKPDGMRLSKTFNGETTTHIWDASNIVLETDKNNATIGKYIRGIGLISNQDDYYYLFNAHGDVVQLANKWGVVAKEYNYDAYGNSDESESKVDITLMNNDGYGGSLKQLVSQPSDNEAKSVISLPRSETAQFAETEALGLINGKPYTLEFTYWADEDNTEFKCKFNGKNTTLVTRDSERSGRVSIYLPRFPLISSFVAGKTPKKGIIHISSVDGDLRSAKLQFLNDVSYQKSGVYISDIKLYNEEVITVDNYNGASKKIVNKPVTNETTTAIVLEKNTNVPCIQLDPRGLMTNSTYVLEFEYWADENDSLFNVDLWPDDLPEYWMTAEKTAKKAKLEFNSNSNSMGYAVVRFFNNLQIPTKSNTYISNIRFYQKEIVTTEEITNYTFESSKINMTPPKEVMAAILTKGAQVPVIYTEYMRLKQNTEYMLEFDYWADDSDCLFNVDLHPDDLPEYYLTADKTVKRAQLKVKSSSANMTNAMLRFFNNREIPNKSNVYISNIKFYETNGIEEGKGVYYNPFRYAGEYIDLETNTYYLRARYYIPSTGRFLNEDPIRDGLNWYTYCGNNPIMFIDPLGLALLRKYVNDNNGSITWNEKTSTATATINGITRTFTNGQNGIFINKDGLMDVPDDILEVAFTKASKIIDYTKDEIKKATMKFGVNSQIIASVIFTEHNYNVDTKDYTIDPIAGWYGIDTSNGTGQIRISTAKFIEDQGYMDKTKGNIFSSRKERILIKLWDDETNVNYATAYLKYFQDTWQADYPNIANDPAILGSLYNLGHSKAPHASPQSNWFGDFVQQHYNAMAYLLGL